MIAPFAQIVVSIWIGVHPVTVTLKKLYPVEAGTCQAFAAELFSHRRNKHQHVEIDCVPTDKRPA